MAGISFWIGIWRSRDQAQRSVPHDSIKSKTSIRASARQLAKLRGCVLEEGLFFTEWGLPWEGGESKWIGSLGEAVSGATAGCVLVTNNGCKAYFHYASEHLGRNIRTAGVVTHVFGK
jgi:hypothetical protein